MRFTDEVTRFTDAVTKLTGEVTRLTDAFTTVTDEVFPFIGQVAAFTGEVTGFTDAVTAFTDEKKEEKKVMPDTMSERGQNIFDMFRNTVKFDDLNSADYASLPEAAARFASVRAVIAALENYSADKMSGARGQAVEQKSVLRAAIRRKMTDYSRTARALNIDDPGFRRLFRVPDGDNDEVLIAAAREFVEEARRFETQFASLGILPAYTTALETDANALEAAMGAKASAHLEGVGATAGIDAEIEKGMADEIVLDAIMKNVYRDNPVKLAEWTSARHVKRVAQSKSAPETPPAPPAPAP